MRTLLLLFCLSLAACSPFIDTKHGLVSAGFLSSTQAFSGKMKCSDGSSVVWSVTGTDGTSVANNALGTITTVSAGTNLLKTVQSNNAAKTTQQAQALNAQTQQAQISATAAQDAATTAAKSAHFQSAVSAGLFTPVPLPTPH